MIDYTEKQDRIINIFFRTVLVGTIAAMLGIIIYFIIAYSAKTNGSDYFDWLLGVFSDFVVIMDTSIGVSPYITDGASYPPLAIIILYPFALICKSVYAKYSSENLTVDELTSKMVLTPQFWIAMVLFFAICSAAIIYLISKKYGLHGTRFFKVAVIIIFSAPFVYAVMRGNTIYFALVFLLVFLLLKDSEKAWVREISYIFLALAGCIKIYPLFFGVFLLKDKKIFASVRVAIYTFFIFYLSFFIFERGIVDFSVFLGNLGGFITEDNRLLAANNLSISGLIYKILYFVTPLNTSGSTAYCIANWTVLAVVFIVSTIAAVATRSDFSRYVISFAIVVLIPSISYFYVLVFAILPFMEYIKNYDKMSRNKQKLYFCSFMVLFITFFILPKFFVLHSAVVLTMLVVELVSVYKNEIFSGISRRRIR